MYKLIRIGKLNINLVCNYFRKRKLVHNDYELGFMFNRYKIVANAVADKTSVKPSDYFNHTVGSYRLGVKIIIFHLWIEIDYDGMHI